MSWEYEDLCPRCALIEAQIDSARRREREQSMRAAYATELAVVALRMLKRAGKLKPTTDDERAALALATPSVNTPGGNRRLLDARVDDYVATAVAAGQTVLFDAQEKAT